MRNVTVVAAIILAAGVAPVRGQAPPVTVGVTGRVQVQWNSTSVADEEAGGPVASSTFETRRVRLGVNVLVSDWIRGAIEPEFALGRFQIRQAWMALEVDSALVIRAGQFKKPFSMIFLTSSTAHPMIERGVRIRGLAEAMERAEPGRLSALDGALLVGEQHALLDTQGYLAYELGATLEGRRGGLAWAAGVFNGSGPDARDDNDDKSFAARASYTVDVGTPLKLGAAWSRRELTWTDASTRTGNAYEVDVELGGLRRGVWLLGEVSTGRNLVTREQFTGAQAVLSYFHATGGARVEGIEPMGRISWADPDDTIDGDAGMLLTPGVNVYFFGRNRLMLNWDVYVPESDVFSTQHAGRAQMNLYF